MLVDAEAFEYLLYLLANHQLELPTDLASGSELADMWSNHSLGRRRYLAWYAVRGAAAALLRSGMDQAFAGQALCDEIRRRSRWLHSREAQSPQEEATFCFAPRTDSARTLITRLFLDFVAPIGNTYWSSPPESSMLGQSEPLQAPKP